MMRDIIILTPTMASLAPDFIGALRRVEGIELRVNPLAGLKDAAALDLLREPVRGNLRVSIVPAHSVAALGYLPDFLPQSQILHLESADIVRSALLALRAEAWRAQPGPPRAFPIPDDAWFRPLIDLRRLENMIRAIYVGRAVIHAAAGNLRVDGCDIAALPPILSASMSPFSPSDPQPLEDIVQNASELRVLIRDQRMPFNDVSLPALPSYSRRVPQIAAYLCGRDIADYLPVLVNRMQAEDVPLIYIDNDSTDGSADLARDRIGSGIASVHRLAYDGAFSLQAQHEMKARLIAADAPRWALHLDADEIIEHRDPDRSLVDLTTAAEQDGHNCINFEEFVFLPCRDEDFTDTDYLAEMKRYYMYAPTPFRLLRLFRTDQGLSNLARGGHYLSGPMRLAPVSHNLRHYIALNQESALRKYRNRVFDPAELARNWHANRTGIAADALQFPAPGTMCRLDRAGSRAFDRSHPLATHWWQWTQPVASS